MVFGAVATLARAPVAGSRLVGCCWLLVVGCCLVVGYWLVVGCWLVVGWLLGGCWLMGRAPPLPRPS